MPRRVSGVGSDLPKIPRIRKRLAGSVAVLSAIAGFAATLAITAPPGPGLDPDAASYLGAAESLARGHGYRVPIASWSSPDSTSPLAHFPPGFPIAIALPTSLGISAVQGARFVNATAAAITLATTTYLVSMAAGIFAGLALGLAFLVTPAFVDAHLSVLSEPLFLACFALSIAAMSIAAHHASERADRSWTLLSGLAAAAALLVRYAGIAATGAVTLWAIGRRAPVRERLRRAALAVLPTIVLLAPWVVHARRASGPHAIRRFAIYGHLGPTLAMGRDTIIAWLVPWSDDEPLPGRSWIALAAVLFLALLVALGTRALVRGRTDAAPEHRNDRARRVLASCTVLAVCYLVVLVLSRSFADPGIPFDWRILAPLLLLLEVVFAVTIGAWWRSVRPIARVPVALVLLAWGAAALSVADDDVSWASEHGVDFAGDQWQQSAVLAWARGAGRNRVLYSNWPVAIYFHLHRHAWAVPEDTVGAAELHAFADTLRARRAALLLFDAPSPGYVPSDSLARIPGLRSVARLADGRVFEAPADSVAGHPAATPMAGRARSH